MTHGLAAALAAFLASLVECVEALTVVLAVGIERGWPGALAGSLAALLTLGVIVLVFGPVLGAVPLGLLQGAVGLLLVLFGLRWLRKAILRAAGAIPLHDEVGVFARERAALRRGTRPAAGWDGIAVAAAFKIVMLEGIEVVFIVIAVGAGGGALLPAILGAGAALGVVILLGLLLHRPLARVPENTLKFAVGVLLSAFGTFWLGEGLGAAWPGGDWSLPALVGLYLLVALAGVALAHRNKKSLVAATSTATTIRSVQS